MVQDGEAEDGGAPGDRRVPRQGDVAQRRGGQVRVVHDREDARALDPVRTLGREGRRAVPGQREDGEERGAGRGLVVVVAQSPVEGDGGQQRAVGREELRVVTHVFPVRVDEVPHDGDRVRRRVFRGESRRHVVLPRLPRPRVSHERKLDGLGPRGAERELRAARRVRHGPARAPADAVRVARPRAAARPSTAS